MEDFTTLEIILSILCIILVFGIFSIYNDLDKVLGRVSKLDNMSYDYKLKIEMIDEIIEKQLNELYEGTLYKINSIEGYDKKLEELEKKVFQNNISKEDYGEFLARHRQYLKEKLHFIDLKKIQEELRTFKYDLALHGKNRYEFNDWENYWKDCWNKYPETRGNRQFLSPRWKYKYITS